MKTPELSSSEAHAELPSALWRVLAKLPYPAWLLRSDGSGLSFNAAFHAHCGLDPAQAEGFGWLSCFPADDVARTPLHWRRVLAHAGEQTLLVQLRNRAGQLTVFEASICPLDDGSARAWVVAEPLARSPQALRESTLVPRPAAAPGLPGPDSVHEQLFEQSFEPQFVWERAPTAGQRRITHWNGAASRLYGFALPQALGCDPRVLLHTRESATEEMAAVDAALDATGQWHGELGQCTAGGAWLRVETAMRVLRDADGRELVLESGRDVTAAREHERAQHEAETRLRLALAASATGIWEWRLDTGRVHGSAEIHALLGLPTGSQGLSREELSARVHPEDRPLLFDAAAAAAERGGSFELTFRIVREPAELRWLHNRAQVERDAAGRALRIVGTLRDVTEQRALDLRALTSETSYRELANSLPQYIWTASADGEVLWVNEHFRVQTGLPVDCAGARDLCSLVHPDDHARATQQSAEALRARVPYAVEYRLRLRDGDYRWVLAQVMPIRSEAGDLLRWVGIAVDIDARRRAEETQRDSEYKWSRVFHLNPRATAISRLADGVLLDVNDAFVRMSGFTREQIIGRSLFELGAWPTQQELEAPSELAASGGRESELSFRTRHGRVLRLSVSSARFETAGEACLLHVVSDVTERHSAAEALRVSEARARANAAELATLMDAVPASVWIARDRECREVQGNQAAHESLRVDQGRNLSKTASDPTATRHFEVYVNGVKQRPEDLPLQRAARDGVEVRDFDEELRFDNGDSRFLFGSAVPLRDESGQVRGAIASVMDVTPIKRAENALREADRRKDEFLAMLSHELRNPLAPIVTALQLMQLRGDTHSARERDVIMRQAQHLIRLVDDLLDVSRIARGKVELALAIGELGPVVAKALEATAPLYEQRQQQLEISVPAQGLLVHADEVRLTQIVSNLLTNAARYTPVGGRIRISAAREEQSVVLRVRDNGMGIEPELMASIFEMFVQGERGPDRAGSGLGLGLALVRALTNLHGGSVEAHSAGAGQGSEFVVRLPLAAATAAAPELPEPAPERPGRFLTRRARRVLVVDDNEDAAEMLSAVLNAAGHEVRVANDPVEALAMAEGFAPEVALLDIGLPVMDGYELGRTLWERTPQAQRPVLVALTGYGQQHDRRRSEEAGFALHLVKPVRAEDLLRQLDELPTG